MPRLETPPGKETVPAAIPAGSGGTWRQFWIGLGCMLPWPIGAALAQPLGGDGTDYVIYLIGLFWTLLWDPVAAIQNALPGSWSVWFTIALVCAFGLMWFTVAALPLLGRWPGRQVIGLWSLQFAYAASQALAGYIYVEGMK